MKSSAKIFAATAIALCLSNGSAFAQASLMKECGAEWQDHKAKKAIVPGETWNQFLGECRTRKAANTNAPATAPMTTAPAAPVAAPATQMSAPKAAMPTPAAAPLAPRPTAAAPTYPTAAPVEPATEGKRTPTSGQQAFYARERACGKEWKQRRMSNQIAVGETWPKYLKECNAKLKAAGQ